MESFCVLMRAESMWFSKLVLLFPIGAVKPEILTSKVKIVFLWNTLYEIDILGLVILDKLTRR